MVVDILRSLTGSYSWHILLKCLAGLLVNDTFISSCQNIWVGFWLSSDPLNMLSVIHCSFTNVAKHLVFDMKLGDTILMYFVGSCHIVEFYGFILLALVTLILIFWWNSSFWLITYHFILIKAQICPCGWSYPVFCITSIAGYLGK